MSFAKTTNIPFFLSCKTYSKHLLSELVYRVSRKKNPFTAVLRFSLKYVRVYSAWNCSPHFFNAVWRLLSAKPTIPIGEAPPVVAYFCDDPTPRTLTTLALAEDEMEIINHPSREPGEQEFTVRIKLEVMYGRPHYF